MMRGLRAVRAGMLALALAASTGLLASAPASAAPITCPENTLCVWDQPTEPDNSGPPASARKGTLDPVSSGTCKSLTLTWGGGSPSRAQYFWDKFDLTSLTFYSGDNCSGEVTATTYDGSYGNLGEARSFKTTYLPADCEAGKICFWQDTEFKGEKRTVDWANFCQNNGDFAARAVTNHSPYTITLYEGNYCLGANSIADLPPGKSVVFSGSTTVGRWKLA